MGPFHLSKRPLAWKSQGARVLGMISVLVSVGPNVPDGWLHRLCASLEAQSLPEGWDMEILMEPRGNISESRNLMVYRARGDILAFADTDRYFPSDWLKRLTAPIIAGYCDFSAGPAYATAPLNFPKRAFDRHARHMRLFYESCRTNPARFAMGNSAWAAHVLHGLPFDERLTRNGTGGDDYDINLRALSAGFRGMWVESAWGTDDVSEFPTLFSVFRKRVKYSYGFGIVLHKNRGLSSVSIRETVGIPRRPSDFIALGIRAWAWVASWFGWRKLRRYSPWSSWRGPIA